MSPLHILPEQVFRPIGVLSKSTWLRHWKVKFKPNFYKALSSASLSSLLKLPIVVLIMKRTAKKSTKNYNARARHCNPH